MGGKEGGERQRKKGSKREREREGGGGGGNKLSLDGDVGRALLLRSIVADDEFKDSRCPVAAIGEKAEV